MGRLSYFMNDKKLIRKAISTLFSFMSSVTMTLSLLCLVIICTLMNRSYMNFEINKSGFCERLLDEVNVNFESLGIPGGFSSDVMTNLVDIDQVRKDIYQYTDVIYSEKESNPVAEGVDDKIYDKLKSDLESRNIAVDEEMSESLDYLTGNCFDVYYNTVVFPFTSQIKSMLTKRIKVVSIVFFVLLAFTIFLKAFIFLINPKDKRSALQYVIYSLTASLIYILFISGSLFSYSKINRFSVYEALYYFTMSYVKDLFFCVLMSSILVIVFLLASIYIYNKIDKDKKISYEAKHFNE